MIILHTITYCYNSVIAIDNNIIVYHIWFFTTQHSVEPRINKAWSVVRKRFLSDKRVPRTAATAAVDFRRRSSSIVPGRGRSTPRARRSPPRHHPATDSAAAVPKRAAVVPAALAGLDPAGRDGRTAVFANVYRRRLFAGKIAPAQRRRYIMPGYAEYNI